MCRGGCELPRRLGEHDGRPEHERGESGVVGHWNGDPPGSLRSGLAPDRDEHAYDFLTFVFQFRASSSTSYQTRSVTAPRGPASLLSQWR